MKHSVWSALKSNAVAACVTACWLLSSSMVSAAGVPAAYQPIVIQPTGLPNLAEFDLRAAIERARDEKKSLFIYLGADDCPYCRRYEAFLDLHASELVPHFGGHLVVDLRGSLKVNAKSLNIRTNLGILAYADFQRAIGDERARLLYPNVWLLDADLKPLMQMPAGSGTFQTVPEQLEILRLVQ